MSGPRVALAILQKDLLLDLRSWDRLGHMAFFVGVMVVVLSLALPEVSREPTPSWIPPLVWIVFLLTSLLGLARSFQSEVDEGAMTILIQAPCDRGWVFLGKAASNVVTLFAVQVVTALLFELFLRVAWERALPVALGIGLLGAVGLSAIGTLLAAMSVRARFREFLLPILLFPLIIPVLLFASEATEAALAEREIETFWWAALALYDWIVILVGYFVFDFVLEE